MLNYRWPRLILRMLYEFVFVFLILNFLAILVWNETPGLFAAAFLFLLYAASFAMREWIPTHLLLLFLHLLLLGGLYFLPFPGRMGMILMGIQVYLTISALVYSHRGAVIKPLGDIPWPSFLVCCLIYILSIAAHQPILMRRTYIVTMLLLILYYLMLYVEGLTKYMDTARDVSGLPLKRMVHTNTRIIGIIVLILVFGLSMGYIFGTDEITEFLFVVCGAIVQWLFRVIGFLLSKLQMLLGMTEADISIIDGDFVPPEEVTGWGLILELLLMAVFAVGMVFLFYRLLRKLIKLLLKSRSYEGDIIETAEKEKTMIKEKSHGRIRFRHSLTLEEKARRYYKIRIMKHKDEILLTGQSTCRDIMDEIRKKGIDDVEEITEAYAEIRYGAGAVDKKKLKRMKELTER